MPKAVQTTCPQCQNDIYVDSDADTAVCGRCGAVLQRQGTVQQQTPRQPEQSSTTHVVDAVVEDQQAPPSTEASEESDAEETQEAQTADE